MNRNYVGWYKLKSEIEKRPPVANFHAREVWWCSLGANIGFEEDGKNEPFERPVLVLRKFSSELFLGVPLTTTQKDNMFYHPIAVGDLPGSVMTSQVRVLSSRRLNRRLERIGKGRFSQIACKVSGLIDPEKSISADFSAESPVPSGNLYSNNSKQERKSQAKAENKEEKL